MSERICPVTGERIVADLHTHSTASDGTLEPLAVYDAACKIGLVALALSDHDSVDGARAVCGAAGDAATCASIVPAVEISTQTDGRDVHMLGYFIDYDSAGLRELFAQNRLQREQRACAMADLLAEAGYPVSSDSLRASGSTVNRTLLARTLVKAGACASVDDAFSGLIGRKSPYFVENLRVSTAEAVSLIREAGGFAFIAHPAAYRVVDLIAPLKRSGLFGVECHYTLHSAEQARGLLQLAQDEGLAVSGGSDWHGDATHGAVLGGAGLDAAGWERFLQACGRG